VIGTRLPLPSLVRGLSRLTVVLALVQALAGTARADEVRPFRYNARLEIPLVGVGAASWILMSALLAPKECRLCGENPLDARVQENLRWSNPRAAQRGAHVMLFGLVPVATVGSALATALANRSGNNVKVDAMVILESFLLTANLTAIAKVTVARRRPFVNAQNTEQRDFVTPPREDNVSFFSGHTSTAFSLAVAAGATASFRGYKQAPTVWAIGMPLAALTGYLSIAADRHYFTDVLTGALVGSAIGVLIPWLHARGQSSNMPSVSASPGTVMFSWVR
jgi:membrane-associated phospholipid phosphatase